MAANIQETNSAVEKNDGSPMELDDIRPYGYKSESDRRHFSPVSEIYLPKCLRF